MTADKDGQFKFKTVLPNNYPVPGENWTRVKHIHFKLFINGCQPLTSEIELLPDDYTQQDQLYNSHLAVTLQAVVKPSGLKPEYWVHFDFVLRRVSAGGYALAAKFDKDTGSRVSSKTRSDEKQKSAPQISTHISEVAMDHPMATPIPERASTDKNPFVGTWTYRSFINKPEPVSDFNDIALWQATLTIEDDGRFLVKGRLEGDGDVLDVHGSVSMECDPPAIRLRAVGVPGNAPTKGWIYDYVGTLTYTWPDGDGQRPSIVGTVIRTVPHATNRQAALSYSFIAVNQQVPPSGYRLPDTVVKHFADRMHRLHHSVWHGIRMGWNDLNDQQRTAITGLGWQPTNGRIALFSGGQKTRPCVTNGSGEDFLFFHRQMVVHYLMMMKMAGADPIGWAEIPQPGGGVGDAYAVANAVPPAWPVPDFPNFERRLAQLKTDVFYWSRMRWWEYQFKDPTYLATLTLGELGSLIEFSVHNDMHIRWSATPRDPVTNEIVSLGRDDWDISEKWDDPRYNWLGEFYSSHVNPVFWRLHGWIDDRIEEWFAAHELKHPGEVRRMDKGGIRWFEVGRWVQVEIPWVWPKDLGGIDLGHDDPDPALRAKRIASMEAVVALLSPPPQPAAEGARREFTAATRARRALHATSVVGF